MRAGDLQGLERRARIVLDSPRGNGIASSCSARGGAALSQRSAGRNVFGTARSPAIPRRVRALVFAIYDRALGSRASRRSATAFPTSPRVTVGTRGMDGAIDESSWRALHGARIKKVKSAST